MQVASLRICMPAPPRMLPDLSHLEPGCEIETEVTSIRPAAASVRLRTCGPLPFKDVVCFLEEHSIEGQGDLWRALQKFTAVCEICTMEFLNTDLKQFRWPMLVRFNVVQPRSQHIELPNTSIVELPRSSMILT
jgi:hypothetical protein